MTRTFSPRIYVACLSSYNNGVLHGAWIDADQSPDAIQEEVALMLRKSPHPNVTIPCPACEGCTDETRATCSECKGKGKVLSAEEWAIHDYDDFGGVKLSESASFEDVSALAEALSDKGEAFALWIDNGNDVDTMDRFEECYAGEWDTLIAFAENLLDETGQLDEIPQWARNYFDMDAYARDLELGGDVWSACDSDHNLHVFWNR